MTSHDEQEDWHDELVAYLDGEVSTEEREQIEQRLTDDDAYRSQLVELERSWRLLDRLPTAEQDRDFTKSTIAMVAADLSNTGTNGKPDGTDGFQIPWGKLLATAAACALGFLAVVLTVVLPDRGQLTTTMEDLAVAQNHDLYGATGSVEFLKLMYEEGLFVDEPSDTSANADWSHSVDAKTIRSGIEKLDDNEKQELAKRRERFNSLSEEMKTRDREMHKQLVADKDKTTLFRTMQAHRDWLIKLSLSSVERGELLNKKPKERVEKIRELRMSGGNDERVATSAEELKKFYLETLTAEQRDELKQLPDTEMKSELRRMFLEDRE